MAAAWPDLTSYDEPHSFGYTLSDINGPLAPLVGGVQGMWLFQDVTSGPNPATKITWRWTLHPAAR